MAITLADARTIVSDHLDDDGTRWATAKVDTALRAALSASLREYTEAGRQALAEEVAASSTTSGILDLSSYNVLKIHNVSIKVGSHYYPLRAVEPEHRDRIDSSARACHVFLTRDFTLPSDSAHPLVGIGATSAGSSQAFDHWVCARAAAYLKVKDDEQGQPLANMLKDLRDACLREPSRPGSRQFAPRAQLWTRYLHWYWSPRDGHMTLCRSRGA